jgi:hypothetical protein
MNRTMSRRGAGSPWRAAGRWQVGALLACLLVVAAAPLAAQQQAQTDPRWEPWLGCWQPVSGPARAPGDTTEVPLVCVIPAPGSVGVDVVAIANGQIATRTPVEATGTARPVTRQGCTGWESAQFSSEGARVYLTAEYMCPGDLKRATSEIMAITPQGEWLDVKGATVRGIPAGVRVLRYREADKTANVPSDLAWAVEGGGDRAMAVQTARLAAAQTLVPADVVEASHLLDPSVVEAWLAEEGQGFDLTGNQLVELKREGVPGRVIDVMVALTYPDVFALDVANHQPSMRASQGVSTPDGYYGHPGSYGWGYASPFGCYSPFSWDCYSPYGWGYYSRYYSPYYSPYGYGYGYGYYPAGGIIVVNGGAGQTRPHGRMVIGHGYTQGGAGGGAATGAVARPRQRGYPQPSDGSQGRSSPPPPSARGSSGGQSAPAPRAQPAERGSSGSGRETGRSAHPRP